jgi:hypothetical protein
MVLHLTQGKVFYLDERLSVNEKSLAGRRQAHLARTALDELDPKLALQGLNPQAQRGLGQVEARGGTPKMPLVSDRNKCAYSPQLHSTSPPT